MSLKQAKAIWKLMPISLALVAAFAQADDSVATIEKKATEETVDVADTVVITATRTPVKVFNADANISVLTAQEIEKKHYTDLSEALRTVQGVSISNYSVAGYDNSNGLRINGSTDVVVLVDGVKVNAAGVNFPATVFKDMKNIERIEVLKGSASTLYGSNAKGGVINIITKKTDINKTRINLAFGSNGRELYSLSNEGRIDSWGWRINAQKERAGAFRDGERKKIPAHLDEKLLNIKLNKSFGDMHDITLTYDKYRSDSEYAAPWEPMKNGESETENAKLIYNLRFNDNFNNKLSLMHNMYDTDFNKYKTRVKTESITDQFTAVVGGDLTLIGGFEIVQDTVKTMNDKKITNRAYFTQAEWQVIQALKITGGIRHDNNSSFGNHNTPAIKIGVEPTDWLSFYLGYSEYFITPTPTHLYSPKYGNPNMKPETGKTKEAGLNIKFTDSFYGTAHIYRRNSDDVIGYDRVTNKYVNMDSEKATGWDIQLSNKFNENWNAYVGYTHTRINPTLQRAKNVDGYIPSGAWLVGVDYTRNKFSASITGKGSIDKPGPRTPDAYKDFFPKDNYWVWDLSLNYQPTNSIKTFVKVNNIFNEFYAEHSNARKNWGGKPAQWWTSPGRNFMAGVEYSF